MTDRALHDTNQTVTEESRTHVMTATVTAGQFQEMITDLLRTAGSDITLPMLMGVRLHSDKIGDRPVLVGVATDRFTMGQAHIEATGELPELFIPAPSCKRLVAGLKMVNPQGLLELVVDDNTLSFTSDGVTVRASLQDVDFPISWKIFQNLAEAEAIPASPTAFNPALLTRFAAIAKSRGEQLHLTIATAGHCVKVAAGSRYRGLIMPVRCELPDVPILLAGTELAHKAKHVAEQAAALAALDAERNAAELKAKRSAAAKKAAATWAAGRSSAQATPRSKKRKAA